MNTTALKSPNTGNRFTFIDGLRGLAALAVVGFHFYVGSPLYTPLSQILPSLISLFLEHGYLAVEVFFVISGFVIAYSLRSTSVTLETSVKFTILRLIRLNPPYIATIALTILLNYISNLFLSDRQAPKSEIHEILYHLFYLQDILGVKQISPVLWTLCIEVQFYIAFLILLRLSQISENKVLKKNYHIEFWMFALFSIFLEISRPKFSVEQYFILYWYAFFLGTLIQWVSNKTCHKSHLLIFFVILISVSIFNRDLEVLTVLVSGIIIAFSLNYKKIGKSLNHSIFQYLGKISYSLYLVHPLIGARTINICHRFIDITPMLSIGVFLLAVSVSIFGAHLMYIYIEKPAIKISRKIKDYAFANSI
jgi:peptidoglycan/LPS O-acetylase OafA/YrhL